MMPINLPAEPCLYPGKMGIYACENRHQCWEPCGELGHSEQHARRAADEPLVWLHADEPPLVYTPAKLDQDWDRPEAQVAK